MGSLDLIPYPQDMVQEADLLLAQTLQQWAETEVISKRLEYREDYEKLIKPAMRSLFVDVEMQKMIWPEGCGGIGLNKQEIAQTLTLALEQVGRADTGIGFLAAVTFTLCSSFALESTMKEELCQRIAPLFCQSEDIALGSIILPAFGRESDLSEAPQFRGRPLAARARREGDNWVINGKNLRPLNSGSNALLFGLLCALENEEEPALILVPGDSPGLTRGESFLKTGLTASINADINLEEVRVPLENLVFRGENRLRQMITWLYLNVGAVTVGSLFATFEIIRDWGDTRVIKGKGNLFKENPLTASLMGEIGHEILLSRLLLHQLAKMLSNADLSQHAQEERLFIPALSVVSHITHAAEKAINQTMELMGSAGYSTEWNLERYWRDIKAMQVHLGSWELNKLELARYFFKSQSL